jgi:voltage-gated potassium channel Kch
MTGERGDSSPGGRVVLLGDDGLGVRVLQELRELGIAVTAVCMRPEAPFALAAQAAQVPLVVGDPENEDTLKEAGVDKASVCGLLGDADLTNLHVALELQEMAPRARVVMRLFNISLTGAVRSMLGDVAVLSATELAVPAFVEAALRGSVGFELRAGDRQVAVQEVDLGHPDLWLALAEAESAEGNPRSSPPTPRGWSASWIAVRQRRANRVPGRPVVSTRSLPHRMRDSSPLLRACRGRVGYLSRVRLASWTAVSRSSL